MMPSRILVALATYNEMGNLPSLVDEIERVLPDADLLVVDDNSPDSTGRWCDERAQKDSRLGCIHRAGKQGLGSATIAAMRYAINGAYNVFISMDADWSHDPQYLPALVRALDDAEVALGSRYCAGGAIEGWPLHRRLLSRAANGLTGMMLRLPVRDTSGAFRAYRVASLKTIDLNTIRAAGYAYLEEILWHLHRAGARMVDVPITFRERRAGRSKINAKEAVSKLQTLCRLACSKA
jgi:dolichol-phosphate mannosyltransferase